MTKVERLAEYGLIHTTISGIKCVRVGNVAIPYEQLNTTCDVLALQGKHCYCTNCYYHGIDDTVPVKMPYGTFYVDKMETYNSPDIQLKWADDDRKGQFTYNGKVYEISYFKECSWWTVRLPTIYELCGNSKTYHYPEDQMKIKVEADIMEQIRLDTISIK